MSNLALIARLISFFSTLFYIRQELKKIVSTTYFRVLSAIFMAYFFMIVVNFIEIKTKNQEFCHPKESLPKCFYRQALSLVDIGNIDSFSILTAASLYLLESGERRQKTIYEAWQVIDNAAAAKVPTSYARIKALEDLNNYGVSLRGLDVPGADLKEIRLVSAKLQEADFQKADLQEADLQGADLQRANLQGANLQGANLQGADLQGADLQGVKKLTIDQVQQARNWETAAYDPEFREQLGLSLNTSESNEGNV